MTLDEWLVCASAEGVVGDDEARCEELNEVLERNRVLWLGELVNLAKDEAPGEFPARLVDRGLWLLESFCHARPWSGTYLWLAFEPSDDPLPDAMLAQTAEMFTRHLPIDKFDWERANVDTAWDEFLRFCECRPGELLILHKPGHVVRFVDALGPARYAVYRAGWACDHWYIVWNVYQEGRPPWLDDLVNHLVDLGRPEDAKLLVVQLNAHDEATDVSLSVSPEVMDRIERECRKRQVSGVSQALLEFVEKELGDVFKRVCKTSRESLITAAAAYHRDDMPGSAATELWVAIEAEFTYRVARFRQPESSHEDLAEVVWVGEIIDGPFSRLVFYFINSRRGNALKDGRTRGLLRRLHDLRNAHAHPRNPIDKTELRAVTRAFWEDGILCKYLEALLPSPKDRK